MRRQGKAQRITESVTDSALFGECIRQARWDSQLSQAQVCNAMGTERSQSWLSNLERGNFSRLPRWIDFHSLCTVLKLNGVVLLVECGYITSKDVREFQFAYERRRR